MPIFKITGKRIQKIKPKKLSGSNEEKQLQNLIENNLDLIFDMNFVETEFSTSYGGRIDTLAIDRDRRPVVIEYKADKSSTILLQGLFYMDWLVENKAEFEKVVRHKLKKEITINWKNGVRLILIAKSFEIWDKFSVNRIKEEVELYEYNIYENNEIKLEKAALPKDFKKSIKTSITSIKEYTIEDQIKKIKAESIIKMVNYLRDRIKLISDDIEERATYKHIKFKSTINFAAIYTQKKQFWLDVRLYKNDVKKQYKQLDVRPHKDEVFTHIRCKEDSNLEDLILLVKQAYENTK